MYAYIKGTLVEMEPSAVTVDVGGIGYRVLIPVSTYHQLPQIGESITLYTSFVVREDEHLLYGFLNAFEKTLFEIVTSVSGIGPKIGLSLIGHLTIDQLQDAVSRKDIVKISKVPGIGKKTAERLIIELRDKLSDVFPALPSKFTVAIKSDPRSEMIRDAMSALVNLGYSQAKAQTAIQKALEKGSEDIELPSLITQSLKFFAG